MKHDNENVMVILSSPSGVGKTTITKKIQQKYQSFKLSVSQTTRKPRSNEVNGIDYYFVTEKEFKKSIESNDFYEYAKIFDNYYGTEKKKIDEILENNDIIFDIDWQGTKQLSRFKKLNLLKIFLVANDKTELRKRLIERNQNTKEEVEKRLDSFENDIKHWNDYDFVIINDNLENCFKQIEKIIINHKNPLSSTFN